MSERGETAVSRPRKPTDWSKRLQAAKRPHIVTLASDFAGVKAGSTMLISSPAEISGYLAKIPRGERRTIARMRSDMARRASADAMCPVTTAIYLRIVAEVALADLGAGIDRVGAVALVAGDKNIDQKNHCHEDEPPKHQKFQFFLIHISLLSGAIRFFYTKRRLVQ